MSRLLALVLLSIIALDVTAGDRLRVQASVPPIAALAEAVGGSRVEVHSLLRPGDNPVTFAPTPRQLARLADSRLFVAIGVPFEKIWLPRIRQLNSKLQVLDLRAGLDDALLPAHRHAGEDPHSHDAPDPHLWTNPIALIHMSRTLRDALIRLDPDHADGYRQRQAALASRLQALDHALKTQLEPIKNRDFLVFHPAWGYFARRYGLHQIAIEHEGKQGGARWMAELIERARKGGIQVIVVQPQFDRRLAQQIAQAIDGHVVSIDPLAHDIENSLRRLARVIAGDTP